MAEPLHEHCVVCQAHARAPNARGPGEETIILLGILLDGLTVEELRRDLCFVHRRRVEDVARHLGGAA
jgi:hypothetical protein